MGGGIACRISCFLYPPVRRPSHGAANQNFVSRHFRDIFFKRLKRGAAINHVSMPAFELESLSLESAGIARGCRRASSDISEKTTHAPAQACGTRLSP